MVFIAIRIPSGDGYFFHDRTVMDFKNSQPIALPGVPIKEAVRETPAFALPAVAAAIGISLGLGVVVFLGVWGFFCAINSASPWRPAAALSGVAMVVCVLYWAFDGAERIMWQRETVIGQDINRDGFIGQPTKPVRSVVVETHTGEGNNWRTGEFPLPDDDAVYLDWIDAAIHRRSLAAEKWEALFGYVYPSGIKTPVYTLFKKELDKNKWIIDRGSHGILLSNEGRAVFVREKEQLALPESVE